MKVHAHDHFNNSGLCAPEGELVTICGYILSEGNVARWDQTQRQWRPGLTCGKCKAALKRVSMWQRVGGGPV